MRAGGEHLLLQADARHLPIADGSVHCVVTSPPYWGLRDYRVGGQIGLESTPDAFVAAMVAVFREVRRVLRDDGTVWLNLGDSYCTSPAGNAFGNGSCLGQKLKDHYQAGMFGKRSEGLKPKDLIGIPWRVALALQADGWWLRSEIIWAKPNPMPESVTDRPTKSHEQVFLLAKRESYFYDQEAVRIPSAEKTIGDARYYNGKAKSGPPGWSGNPRAIGGNGSAMPCDVAAGANLRTVWTIPTEAYPGAHFATFPRRLVEPCIRAGSSERGVCPECGAPHERVVERGELTSVRNPKFVVSPTARGDGRRDPGKRTDEQPWDCFYPRETTGWRPTCSHDHDPIPATVCDIFAGSGTTLVVANALGRRAIGCDLSREYLGLAQRRVTRPHARVPRPGREEHHPLFDGA